MQIAKRIFKEIGIALLFLILIVGILVIAFYEKVPFGKDVPEPKEYTAVDRTQYSVNGNIEDMQNPTLIYQTTARDIQTMDTEKIVSPGKIGIFSPTTGVSNIPTERVSGSSSYTTVTTDSLTTDSVSDTNTESESSLE